MPIRARSRPSRVPGPEVIGARLSRFAGKHDGAVTQAAEAWCEQIRRGAGPLPGTGCGVIDLDRPVHAAADDVVADVVTDAATDDEHAAVAEPDREVLLPGQAERAGGCHPPGRGVVDDGAARPAPDHPAVAAACPAAGDEDAAVEQLGRARATDIGQRPDPREALRGTVPQQCRVAATRRAIVAITAHHERVPVGQGDGGVPAHAEGRRAGITHAARGGTTSSARCTERPSILRSPPTTRMPPPHRRVALCPARGAWSSPIGCEAPAVGSDGTSSAIVATSARRMDLHVIRRSPPACQPARPSRVRWTHVRASSPRMRAETASWCHAAPADGVVACPSERHGGGMGVRRSASPDHCLHPRRPWIGRSSSSRGAGSG